MGIAICIPTHNEKIKIINQAIESAFRQTIQIEEIIVSDDCSKNHFIRELRKTADIFRRNFNVNIKIYFNEINIGYANNWNKCLEYSSSDFNLILHADDMLKHNAVEKLLNYYSRHPDCALVGGQEDIVDETGKIVLERKIKDDKYYPKGSIYEFIKEQGSYIPCSSVMFNMDKIRQVGFFQEDVLATDELYWPKVLQYSPIAVLGESLINRRRHSGQTEYYDFKNKRRQIIEWGYHFKKIIDYEKRPDKRKELKRLVNRKIANGLTGNIFISCIEYHKSMSLAFFYLINGIKVYPKIILELSFWKRIMKSIITYLYYIVR
jgi:glycosyltransferase involved in cell wall biosynthesis